MVEYNIIVGKNTMDLLERAQKKLGSITSYSVTIAELCLHYLKSIEGPTAGEETVNVPYISLETVVPLSAMLDSNETMGESPCTKGTNSIKTKQVRIDQDE